MEVIEAVERVNERQKGIVFRKLKSALGDMKNKTVALWGLAFKPETDDMREAPSLVVAMDECRRRIGDAVVYCRDMYDAVVDADALALITEWKQFRVPSWQVLRKLMRPQMSTDGVMRPVIVDGRNIFDRDEVVENNFTYLKIG